mgnify:CR=1 FL=1
MKFSKKNAQNKIGFKTIANTVKKHPKANLENYSKVFAQLGLVLSLLIIYVLIQSKTFTNELSVLNDSSSSKFEVTTPNIEYEIEPPKEQPQKQKIILDVIKKEDDDALIDESLFIITDPNTPVDIDKIVDVKRIEIIDPKDEWFDINVLEEAPLFPGCKGSNEERKACFSEKISKYINRKFNAGLAEEMGLAPGIQRIFTLFKIDKNGSIIDIQARSPYKELQKEAIRVINLLPKMEPGKQQGNPVIVKYSMPIIFNVQ